MSTPFRGLLVGAHFRGAEIKALVQGFEVGQPGLTIEREPDNTHDFNACKVMWDPDYEDTPSVHLGYVDGGAAAWIASEMDAGFAVESVEVVGLEEDARGNNKPQLLITLKDTVDPGLVRARPSPNFSQSHGRSFDPGDDDIPY